MEILPLFGKFFFSVFFRSKDQRGLENAFDQKKSTVLSDEIGHFQVIFSVHLMVARQ
jgi:hypothetical protein